MHIVFIAWIFVAVLMAAAEATSTQGTVLGALVTLLLYGALPLGIVMYVMGAPARRRRRRAADLAELAALQAQAAATADPMPGAGTAPGPAPDALPGEAAPPPR